MRKKLNRFCSTLLAAALVVGTFVPLVQIRAAATERAELVLDWTVAEGYSNDLFSLPQGCDVWKPVEWKQKNLLGSSNMIFNTFNSNSGLAKPGTYSLEDGTVVPNLAAKGEYGYENGILKFVKYGCSNEDNLFNIDAWGGGDTMDLMFELSKYADLTDFVLFNRSEKQFQTAYYELYAATDKADLFNKTSKIAVYDRRDQLEIGSVDELQDRRVNHFTFNGVTNVGYFAIRLKYPEPLNASSLSFRALHITLCGTESENEVDKGSVKEDNLLEIPSENLLSSVNTVASSTIYNPENLADGNAETDCNSQQLFAEFVNGAPVIHDDGTRSFTLYYDFGERMNITSALVLNHLLLPLRTWKYELYAANQTGVLFDTDNRVAEFTNGIGTRRQIFEFADGAVHSKRYFGIKVLYPCFDKSDAFDVTKVTETQNNIYTRLSEFRVYGTPSGEQEEKIYSSTNNFENVQGYNNESFVIENTGDADHGKALVVPNIPNAGWAALEGGNIGTYVSEEGEMLDLFNESLVVGDNYILSYDYKLVEPADCKHGDLFSLALKHDDFTNGNGDWLNWAKSYFNTDWHTKAVGFTASTNKATAKVLVAGRECKCYVDNYKLQKAAVISVNGNNDAVKIIDVIGNIMPAANNLNGKMLAPMGEAVSFKLDNINGSTIASVKVGENEISADSNGVYTVEKLEGNIEINLAFDNEKVLNTFYTDGEKLYVPFGSTVYSVARQADIPEYFAFSDKATKDTALSLNDKIYFGISDKAEYTYMVAFIGDYDGDGKLSVTDLVGWIDCIITSDSSKADIKNCDMNADGILSVSDIVIMRRCILNSQTISPNKEMIEKMDSYIADRIAASGITGVDESNLKNGIVNVGDRTRIANVIRKALRGEEITVCCLGGSVTEGAVSTKLPEGVNCTLPTKPSNYCDLLCGWFTEMFGCKVNKVNAGISATDSVLGVHRITEDVLPYNPDLVVVEYAVNEIGIEYKGATYEALVRELLNSGTAVMLLEVCCPPSNGLASAQVYEEPVAYRYQVPMVSYRDAYKNVADFEKFAADVVHPNIIGHTYLALNLVYYIEQVYSDISNIAGSGYGATSGCYYSDAEYYSGSYMADFEDIIKGKVSGVKITDMGSFKLDTEKSDFVQHNANMGCNIDRSYYGVSAKYSDSYKPMVIEIESCRSMFIQMLRAGTRYLSEGAYKVEINGTMIEDPSLQCSDLIASDNTQVESYYHWASARLFASESGEKLTVKIYPTSKDKNSMVTLYSLLLS